jgi:hypothetical protein
VTVEHGVIQLDVQWKKENVLGSGKPNGEVTLSSLTVPHFACRFGLGGEPDMPPIGRDAPRRRIRSTRRGHVRATRGCVLRCRRRRPLRLRIMRRDTAKIRFLKRHTTSLVEHTVERVRPESIDRARDGCALDGIEGRGQAAGLFARAGTGARKCAGVWLCELRLRVQVVKEVVGERAVLVHVDERGRYHVGAHGDFDLTRAVEQLVDIKVAQVEHVGVVRRGQDGVQRIAVVVR